MQPNWFEGQVFMEMLSTPGSEPFPIHVVFTNNGIMSVTVGDENYRPAPVDLTVVGTWAQGVAKAMGVPDEQVFVGAYRCQVTP